MGSPPPFLPILFDHLIPTSSRLSRQLAGNFPPNSALLPRPNHTVAPTLTDSLAFSPFYPNPSAPRWSMAPKRTARYRPSQNSRYCSGRLGRGSLGRGGRALRPQKPLAPFSDVSPRVRPFYSPALMGRKRPVMLVPPF